MGGGIQCVSSPGPLCGVSIYTRYTQTPTGSATYQQTSQPAGPIGPSYAAAVINIKFIPNLMAAAGSGFFILQLTLVLARSSPSRGALRFTWRECPISSVLHIHI
jgi:hypothetical protein